ncbi:class I SAM-dependent methyltransferase [Halorubrum vacuolatum]|uniref:Ubiquinone/menaquinone biosynthesis C-methylase UbiE n=1 Tax=Halorubrum vacuolatum TaxID=63740 RepID=A0A238VBU4_HALVU|nr:class I SAM-dependent methyltransferase [Halorubrum vacuolatum]SNR31872.1 Ubiquinone/menaquinone biosynthesis C-methylase UbiE [Halorubrum vacuolatum]
MDPQSTYDRIAEHFSQTREYAWPEVETFLAGRSVDLALDLGCGNGRHMEALIPHSGTVLGLDVSRGLLREASARARERGYADQVRMLHGDASRLPIRTNAVDLAVYVATIHHLDTRALRIGSLDELARVLRPDGVALVSAWSTEHDRFDRETSFDTTIDWTLPGGETVPRFYHIYSPREFEADLEESALDPVEARVSSGNCYAVVRPPAENIGTDT